MSAGDIHNHNGSTCKATKKPCPFGDEGHSKDVESFVVYHEEHSNVDGEKLRKFIADGASLGDAVEIAKSDAKPLSSSKKVTAAQAKVLAANAEALDQLKKDLDGPNYNLPLLAWKDVKKVSHEQWNELIKEQEKKLPEAISKAEAYSVEIGYDPNYVGAEDYKALAMSTLEDVRAELKVEHDRLDPKHPYYENHLGWYREHVNRLERLEKLVKPGEEKEYYKAESKRASSYREYSYAVDGVRFRLKYLKFGAELTDPNRKAADGTTIPVGYSVQPAVYNEDGELLGAVGNRAFPPRYTDSKGRTFVARPSEHSDPVEADRRNKVNGLYFGEMLTPSEIKRDYQGLRIGPASQTKAVKEKNIPLASNRA